MKKQDVEAQKDQQYEMYNEELRQRGKKEIDWREEAAEDERTRAKKA